MGRNISIEELEKAACKMRFYALVSIHAAGSGHPGGSLSVMDIVAALYLKFARLDPQNPDWEDRDRIIFSAGHKAPALYAGLALAGFYSIEDMITLRRFNSPFQGHPHAPDLQGVEVSTGSLGQGLSVACGIAISAKLLNRDYRVFCIMGDGEQQEGSIWEAAMTAANYSLDNLVGIVDRNRLQIDGEVDSLMNISPLGDKYRAFGWNVLEIDGHSMGQIVSALEEAIEFKGAPTVIIANTIKGKGVSFMENEAGWHGIATRNDEELFKALSDLDCSPLDRRDVLSLIERAREFSKGEDERLFKEVPRFSRGYWWNESESMRVKMTPTRDGFGMAMARVGEDKRVITIHADISNSIRITEFEKADSSRERRVINAGIAEQDMMTLAAGLAHEGWIPVVGTYGVFAAGRPWDQIRTTICNDNLNVKIAGAHGGISVGPDGGTHQALEDISLMSVLPNMHVGVPCDAEETRKISEYMILNVNGPCYIRFAREATPVVTDENTPFMFGLANVIRYRGVRDKFKDAFETILARDYGNENEDITLIACGPILTEAMRAAYILKEEKGLEARVLNIHTVKPIDSEAILRALKETKCILTCEEHQRGGFGNIVAGVIANLKDFSLPFVMDMIGVDDRFGVSGNMRELFYAFGLAAENIAERAIKLISKKEM